MAMQPLTPSQTVGPFFLDCLLREDSRRHVIAPPGTPGNRIRVEGRVIDGDRAGVPDAMVEVWQADASGQYHGGGDGASAGFLGFGRCATDAGGAFWFETVKPGAVPYDESRMQAPHLNVAIFARGLLNHLFTRIYFADEPENTRDPLLEQVPPVRRPTLMALPNASENAGIYRFDVVLQGEAETVFLDFVRPRPTR